MDHAPVTLPTGMPDIETVRTLERAVIGLPQTDLCTEHLVHGGVYARTITVPADTLITGALTSMDNVCVVHGDITVATDEGTQRLTGFHVLPAKAGAKRAGVTHAVTHWTMLVPVGEETDLAAIERMLTCEPELLQTNRAGISFDAPKELQA